MGAATLRIVPRLPSQATFIVLVETLFGHYTSGEIMLLIQWTPGGCMPTRKIARAGLGLILVAITPFGAAAQQLYECNWTVTITTITTRYADGTQKTEWIYTRTEVCHPI